MDISSLSFDEIKRIVKNELIAEDELMNFIQQFKQDKRKNVQMLSEKLLRKIQKEKVEEDRITAMYSFDKSFGDFNYVAGVDEVGRGPFAGPIVSAAVILDLNNIKSNKLIAGIKDSKLLSPAIREILSEEIKQSAVAVNIALLSNGLIDQRGIGWCNQEVFRRACNGLKIKPDLILSDGYPVKNIDIPNRYVIKGDTKSASIACASIVAKVFRDAIMKEYAFKYPQYGFEHNSGYGTESHIAAIQEFGITEIHRTSFLRNYI